VHWTLDPVDAGSLRTGAVIPVRIDPQAPHTAVLDTLADSRARMDGIDPETAFSTRRRLRQLVSRMRGWSRIAILAGAVVGLLIVLL
jgi:tetrahydromethanopterin S-methyltransferase subunit G